MQTLSFTVTKPADKRIVVMPGSFNPPTRTHILWMNIVLNKLNAERGIFLIESDDCLPDRGYRFNEQNRLDMLKIICRYDERLSVSDLLVNRGNQISVLSKIYKQYPDYTIYILTDAINSLYYKPMFRFIFKYNLNFPDVFRIVTSRHDNNLYHCKGITILNYTNDEVSENNRLAGINVLIKTVTPEVWEIIRTRTNFVESTPDDETIYSGELIIIQKQERIIWAGY